MYEMVVANVLYEMVVAHVLYEIVVANMLCEIVNCAQEDRSCGRDVACVEDDEKRQTQ